MSRRSRATALGPAAALALGPVIALALGIGHAAGQTVGGGPVVQWFTFDEPEAAAVESFRLVTVPFAASVPLGSRLELSVGSAWAEGRATGPGGESASLAGLTDTDVGLSVGVGEWMVLSADATLSTGKSTLSLEESAVASVVAAELIPFPINTWGSGSSFGSTVAVATQAGPWGIGLAAGYRVASTFDPLPDLALAYNPGDQLQLRLALDRDVAGSSTLSLLLGFQHFTDDELSGANIFRSGSRMQGLVSLAFPMGLRGSALVYGGLTHRSQGTLLLTESLLSGARDSPSQQLFLTGANVRLALGRRAALLPSTELRVFRASDGASQGWVGSAGTQLDLRLAGNSSSRRLVVAPSGHLRVGTIVVEEGSETGFFGWELGLVVRVESPR